MISGHDNTVLTQSHSDNLLTVPFHIFRAREGCRARSKALDLGSSLEGVRRFESGPSHPVLDKITKNILILGYVRILFNNGSELLI